MKRNLITNVLFVILLMALLTGCSGNSDNAASSSDDAEKADLSALIDEYKESADMRLNKYSFGDLGGPVMNMYIDEESYDKAEFEGSYLIIPANSGESGTYMETSFRPNESAESLAKTILSEYGSITESTDEGMLSFDGFKPQKLIGYTESGTVIIVYLTDVNAGAVTTVIVVSEDELEGHGMRMQAMAETTIIL